MRSLIDCRFPLGYGADSSSLVTGLENWVFWYENSKNDLTFVVTRPTEGGGGHELAGNFLLTFT